MRINYWSCSKFADKIRGVKKPSSATISGWNEWTDNAKSKNPIRYWIADEGLDILQNVFYFIPDCLYSVKYYIVNRWIDQTHALVAHPKHIKRGSWMDLDARILYCLFDELVDFVEIEKAYSNFRWDKEKCEDKKWWQVGRWRTRTWRCPEAGIDYLKWEMTLTNEDYAKDGEPINPTGQANTAKEILELYTWWTEKFPNRADPYISSGWNDYCEEMEKEHGSCLLDTDPTEDSGESRKILNTISEMEKAYDDENEEMMIRLIKIRGGLWS